MNSEKYAYALLGEKLIHSFSPSIHKRLGLSGYGLIETRRESLESILRDTRYKGFNVTIPYKREVMQYCDEISPEAAEIGSVNTIVRAADGRLHAYNTDIDGFVFLTVCSKIEFKDKKILVFGSGGTSLMVQTAAKCLGALRVTVVSRTGKVSYGDLSSYGDTDIIVNTTPVGMYPNNLASLVSLERFPNCGGVIDVIYNPRRTALIMQAGERGIPCTDGLPMLVYQAKRAEELFLGKSIPDSEAQRVIRELRAERGNIVLVGMPGSGKSSVAERIASITGKTFVNVDTEIEKATGKSIPEIFAKDGEPVFRELERKETAKAGALTGAVIATGGGAVKDFSNYAPLHQNGRIYYLRRKLSELETEGRPLSKDTETLKKLQNEREPLYLRFADAEIRNNLSLEEAAAKILEEYNENICN